MARIPKDGATEGQISSAARETVNKDGHHLSADQRQTLLTGHRAAQAAVLRHLDYVDGLNRSRLEILDGKDASLLYFLSGDEQKIIVRAISYRSSRKSVQALLGVVKKCRRHERKLQDDDTIVELIGGGDETVRPRRRRPGPLRRRRRARPCADRTRPHGGGRHPGGGGLGRRVDRRRRADARDGTGAQAGRQEQRDEQGCAAGGATSDRASPVRHARLPR